MERRRFAVIGLGKFGHHLARSLYHMGHDVLALDRTTEAIEAIRAHCSRAQRVNAADKEDLEAAGAGEADVAVVALGAHLDVSILATLFLKELGVREVVAKAVSHDHGRILSRIGATEVVYPERHVALALAQKLADPDVLERVPFLEGYAVMEIRAPEAIWGKTLAEANLRRDHRVSVLSVHRQEGEEQGAVAPEGGVHIRQGDTLVVLARPEDVASLRTTHMR